MQADMKEKRTPIVKKFEDYQPFPRKRIQYNINRKQRKNKHRKIYRNNTQFSTEEDERILRLVQEMGPKFVKIATFFPNKSYSTVKNRYYKHLRDQETQQQESTPKNERLEELNQLLQTINFSPEISSITKGFIGGLIKCLI